ncbi:2OG-Fe(II) oxygenase family protein [Nocardia cyriacigeorgica]|uniref:2OG-Fe(II) oxygenase family protein n=1 Tax=Nocardia cyriacigeorgica TaxID=135487 RepID=UPI002B4B0E82|nr:2OG-Fe(II) oxygenase family protein [Nocardia cyriacigeorgica]
MSANTSNAEHTKFAVVENDLDNLEYSLVESPTDVFDDSFEPTVCDMADLDGDSAARHRFTDRLGAAMEDVGLAILINHGAETVLPAAADAALQMFTTVPLERKMKYVATDCTFGEPLQMGYIPLQESTESLPNSVEAWELDKTAFRIQGEDPEKALAFWPDERFEVALRPYWQACERMVLPLVHAMFRYLGVEPSLYDEELSPPNSVLRFNHYPPIDDAVADAGKTGRVIAHEDYGLITLLPATPVEGLQLYHPRHKTWSRLHAPAGSIVMNSGDWLKMISNDRFHSCTHRVSVPRDRAQRAVPRLTIPYVVHPHEKSIVEVLPGFEPKYQPISGRDFMTRLAARYLDR